MRWLPFSISSPRIRLARVFCLAATIGFLIPEKKPRGAYQAWMREVTTPQLAGDSAGYSLSRVVC
ncbi:MULTISPECIES: hypothetical protein [Kosakonia]|uniref:hypothetical protein n=1 Tax=Kosakonia TaxID=1330547 RepID=UPI0011C034F1|nr:MULTISPECIES: hypothetical protein [Kosakonia]